MLRARILLVPLALGLALTACGEDSEQQPAAQPAGTGAAAAAAPLQVLASTNVWADVAKQVGGDRVEVSAFISEPSQDPHSYEANTKNVLAVSRADVVIQNGGGYDDFMQQLVDAAGEKPVVVDAVEASGLEAPEGEELNEHVWYDLDSVTKVADEIARALGEAAPDAADEFATGASEFSAAVAELQAEVKALGADLDGGSVSVTEPVAVHLLTDAGLEVATPEEFTEAVEEGEDVAPRVLQETLRQIEDGQVSALVYNSQTTGPVTEKVRQAAEDAGVPVVPVTETLGEGQDYLTWMAETVEALRDAVATP